MKDVWVPDSFSHQPGGRCRFDECEGESERTAFLSLDAGVERDRESRPEKILRDRQALPAKPSTKLLNDRVRELKVLHSASSRAPALTRLGSSVPPEDVSSPSPSSCRSR